MKLIINVRVSRTIGGCHKNTLQWQRPRTSFYRTTLSDVFDQRQYESKVKPQTNCTQQNHATAATAAAATTTTANMDEEQRWEMTAAAHDSGKGIPLDEFDPDSNDDMRDAYRDLGVNVSGKRRRLKSYIRRLR